MIKPGFSMKYNGETLNLDSKSSVNGVYNFENGITVTVRSVVEYENK